MKDNFKKYLAELCNYMQNSGIDLYPFPTVKLNNQPQEDDSIYQQTGYYDPRAKSITLFINGRHDKDILRSFAHELIHHNQNLSGEMTREKVGENGDSDTYAQDNTHLRKLEEDAYLRGNMAFRDWTDKKKYGK